MQQQAAAMSPGLAQSDYNDGNQLQAIGAQRQGLSQQYLNNAQNQFNGASQNPYTQLGRYADVVRAGQGVGGTSSSTGPNPYQSNGLANAVGVGAAGLGIYNGLAGAGLIGGAAGGAAAGAGISLAGSTALDSFLPALAFSDIRLKSDIVKVGTHPLGVGVYDYTKFGKRERGVMAQEVEQVKPDAVSTHESGYKQVNYGLLN